MPEPFSNLSKINKETAIRVIGYFLQQWELETAANSEKVMSKLPYFRLLPESRYQAMGGTTDIVLVVQLLIKELHLEKDFGRGTYGFSKLRPEASFKSLMEKLTVLKERLEKEVRTNKSNKDNLIHSLTLVISKDSLHYLVIVDEKFEDPIEVNAQASTWKLLLRVAEGEHIEYKHEYKYPKDFFNTNRHGKLYTNSGKDLTKILRIDQGKIRSLIDLKAISEKAYKQKLNKLNSA